MEVVVEEEADGNYLYEDHLLPLWLQHVINDPDYDSDSKGSRPIRPKWPKDTLLTRDHFTIDEQQCLYCNKKLGYAMPMNKTPNGIFLFCHNDCGDEICGNTPFVKCFMCGNVHTQQSGGIVHRPGNSAYDGPSQIFQFMCHHCHLDQQKNEPGLEECRNQMKKIRAARLEDEIAHRGNASLSVLPQFTSAINIPSGGKKRKLGKVRENS